MPSINAFDIAHRYVILFWGIFEIGSGILIMRVNIGLKDYGEEKRRGGLEE